QIEAFSKTYRALAPDLPGFGPRSAANSSDQTLARAVMDYCDTHSIFDAHFVGLSLGGAVAIDLALTFPERVRSLCLVDALLRQRPSGILESEQCVALAKAGRMPEATETWLNDPLFASARQRTELFARLKEMAADYDGGHWSGRRSLRFEVEDPASR